MFKKHIIFQDTVHYCRSSMPRLSQTLLTSTVCSDWPADTEHCDWPNTTSGNVTHLSIMPALAFKINVKTINNVLSFTISSSQKERQSRVTDTVMMLLCVYTIDCKKKMDDAFPLPSTIEK